MFIGLTGVKLLGVPALPYKSTDTAGELVSAATLKLLDEWGCRENVKFMVFDTTSANTGNFCNIM